MKGSFFADDLLAESLGGGGLSGGVFDGGCRAGRSFPFTGLKVNAVVSVFDIKLCFVFSYTHTNIYTWAFC